MEIRAFLNPRMYSIATWVRFSLAWREYISCQSQIINAGLTCMLGPPPPTPAQAAPLKICLVSTQTLLPCYCYWFSAFFICNIKLNRHDCGHLGLANIKLTLSRCGLHNSLKWKRWNIQEHYSDQNRSSYGPVSNRFFLKRKKSAFSMLKRYSLNCQ